MAIILDGTNGITYPDNSVQARSIANTSNILATIGPKGVTNAYMGPGTVLQVVTSSFASQVSTTSTSYTDTGLTATITPINSNSKILVVVDYSSMMQADNSATGGLQIVRNSTALSSVTRAGYFNVNANVAGASRGSFSYIDSPATTSATTYKVQYARLSSAGTSYAFYFCINNDVSNITLMEIAV
jgi:hypothetical protein